MAAKIYVLVHGAFHGGWCWREIAQLLRAQGHCVFTPTLSGLAERAELAVQQPTLSTHIEEIEQFIADQQLAEVIIVGHSLGGVVASGVADRIPEKIRHLVFLDAHLLQSGASVLATAPPDVLDYYQRLRVKNGGSGLIPIPPIDFFAITVPEQVAWLEQNLTPQPVETFFSPLQLRYPLGAERPVTYITCTNPYFRHVKAAREFAHSMSAWHHCDIATGHDAMISAPAHVANLLTAIE